jgi:hypothetical protein
MYGRENEHVRGNGDFQKKGPPEHSLLSVEKCLIKQIHWFSDVYVPYSLAISLQNSNVKLNQELSNRLKYT